MRSEPEGASLLDAYPSCSEVFKIGGWYDYCRGLAGNHLAVSKAFAKSFDGEKAEFKSLMPRVTEKSIAQATDLSIEGEKWFKRTSLRPSDFNYLLVSDHKNPDWRKGIPRVWIKKEFRDLLYLIQKYITCERRFALTFLYHLRLLSHLVKDQRLSLPFYFLKSLTKMASKCKGLGEIAKTHLFHHELIKMLIIHELQKVGWTWDQFLRFEGFEASINEQEQLAMPRRAPSSRKGKEKFINRTLRSSASLISQEGLPLSIANEFEDEGWDAPLEPICNQFSEPSLAHIEGINPGMGEEQRGHEVDEGTEPPTEKAHASNKHKRGIVKRRSGKHKLGEMDKETEKPLEIFSARVTRRQGKVQGSDGGDNLMMESVAASSLVKLPTSGKQEVSVSLSRQPFANNTPSGRVTHSKTKSPPPSMGYVLIVYIDLEPKDTTPPTTRKEPSTVQPLSMD